MKLRSWFAFCSMVLGAIFIVAGCAKKQIESTPSFNWASPSGAYMVDDDPVFYAVGKASGIRNATLLRATADNQAQLEMGRIIRNYTARLSKAAGLTVVGDEDLLSFSELARAAVQRARIVDHWYDSDSGTLYALCRLDLGQYLHLLESARHIEPQVQEQMAAKSAAVHAQMVASPAGL